MNMPPDHGAMTACENEAIHLIAAIQGFGGLIAIDREHRLVHRSANVPVLLGLGALPAIGAPLAAFLAPDALVAIGEMLDRLPSEYLIERRFGIDLAGTGALFDCAAHLSCGLAVIEFEPHAGDEFADHLGLIGPVLSRLEQQDDPDRLCAMAARLVREMLGYDRVMVYRFHPDDSGEVIAEDAAEGLEPYLGLRYPAADIPRQARELFRRNRFRVIADMAGQQVPVLPALGPDGDPLDLSMSMLRAHSQMHLIYMRNMGVGASLAIAIVRNDQLWGLIACHHMTPRLPPYSLRTVAELFSQSFSLMLDRILLRRSDQIAERARALGDRLLEQFSKGTALADNLPQVADALGAIIAHDGVSLLSGGAYRALGLAPTQAEFMAVAAALPALGCSTEGNAPEATIFATTMLESLLPEASAFADRAAGALILPLPGSPQDCIALWRRPLDRVVTWAGHPDKVRTAPGRLEPRTSFAAWQDIVRGHGADWTAEDCRIAARLARTLTEGAARRTAVDIRAREQAAEQQDLLIAELHHRVRNILALIRSLVSQSQRDALSVPGLAAIISGRIAALASAHDNIARANWVPASLAALFRAELAPFVGTQPHRFRLDGRDVLVRPAAFTVIALVVHELATNSARYGSLSARAGRVAVRLAHTASGGLMISWHESGGPPVTEPGRIGLGSTIIQRSIPHELGGEAAMHFHRHGLEAEFLIPARHLAPADAGPASTERAAFADPAILPTPAIPAVPPRLPGSVLLVEDSIIIALDTEANLRRLGVDEVRVEGSVAGALAAIADATPDFAILDFNLGDESSEAVAAALRQQGVPFVLATGYAEGDDALQTLGAEAVLRKPYGRAEIERLLESD